MTLESSTIFALHVYTYLIEAEWIKRGGFPYNKLARGAGGADNRRGEGDEVSEPVVLF